MGEVLLAADDRLGRKVAIKRLPRFLGRSAERRERFVREARAIAALSHPSIVAIHDIGEQDGQLYLVLEHVDGRTLSALMRDGPLSFSRATRIAMQIADALRASHAVGILHRDVKPDNVLVTAEDRVKVFDFGLAKDVGERAALSGATGAPDEAGVVVGSLPYMSPEQLRGEEIDFRSDVYALGVVYHEMLAGRRPEGGALAPEVPDRASPILARCLAADRSGRYAGAAELHADLERLHLVLSSRDDLAPASDQASTSSRGVRRGLVAGLAIAALALGIAAAISRHPAPDVGEKSIAILPFVNETPDPDSDYLGPSLAGSVTERLSTVRTLAVRPSVYTARYRQSSIDPALVARDLGVTHLVTGSYRRDAARVTITFEMTRVKTATLLLKRTLRLSFDEVKAFPGAVAEEIVGALAIALSPEEVQRMQRSRPTDAAAYDLYLRAIGLGSEPAQSSAALAMIERSVARDPTYAPAYVELSRRSNEALIYYFGNAGYRDRAIAAARKALELDPRLGIASAQLGNLLVDAGKAEEATEVLRAGAAANPNVADLHHFLAYAYRFGGALDASLRELAEADRVDPLRAELGLSMRNPLLYLGRYEDFIATIPVGTNPYRNFYRGFGHYHLGHAEDARQSFAEAVRLDPENQFSLMGRALALGIDGKREEGLAVAREIVRRREENRIWDGEVTYKLAQIASQLGDQELAARLFSDAVAQGFFCAPYFDRDPLLAPLRDSGLASEAFAAARARHESYMSRFFRDVSP